MAGCAATGLGLNIWIMGSRRTGNCTPCVHVSSLANGSWRVGVAYGWLAAGSTQRHSQVLGVRGPRVALVLGGSRLVGCETPWCAYVVACVCVAAGLVLATCRGLSVGHGWPAPRHRDCSRSVLVGKSEPAGRLCGWADLTIGSRQRNATTTTLIQQKRKQ